MMLHRPIFSAPSFFKELSDALCDSVVKIAALLGRGNGGWGYVVCHRQAAQSIPAFDLR